MMEIAEAMLEIAEAMNAVVTTRGEDWALEELWQKTEKFHLMFWAHAVPDRLLWDVYEEVVGYRPNGYDRVALAVKLKDTLKSKIEDR